MRYLSITAAFLVPAFFACEGAPVVESELLADSSDATLFETRTGGTVLRSKHSEAVRVAWTVEFLQLGNYRVEVLSHDDRVIEKHEFLTSEIGREVMSLRVPTDSATIHRVRVTDLDQAGSQFRAEVHVLEPLRLSEGTSQLDFGGGNYLRIDNAYWGWDFTLEGLNTDFDVLICRRVCLPKRLAVSGVTIDSRSLGAFDYIEIHPKSALAGLEQAEKRHPAAYFRRATCFVAGTPIETPNGAKFIEDFVAGDDVLAADVETGEVSVRKVEQVWVRHEASVGAMKFDNGSELRLTAEHPVFAVGVGDFVAAGELLLGEVVLSLDGGSMFEARVTEVNFSETQLETVYNLRVEQDHTYFADGIWVHNY